MPGYNFSVVIENGVGKVLHVTQGMEDGVWEIGGTDDQWGASINVTHKRPSGQYVAEAQHASNPENYKAPDIPGLDKMKSVYISMGFPPGEAERYAMQALSNLPGGVPVPVPVVPMPPGLKNPAEDKPASTPQWEEVPLPEDGSVPPGAKPFDFNDKSTWTPELLAKSRGAEDGDPEPRMRGDISL